jgi:hypothetical protein
MFDAHLYDTLSSSAARTIRYSSNHAKKRRNEAQRSVDKAAENNTASLVLSSDASHVASK